MIDDQVRNLGRQIDAMSSEERLLLAAQILLNIEDECDTAEKRRSMTRLAIDIAVRAVREIKVREFLKDGEVSR